MEDQRWPAIEALRDEWIKKLQTLKITGSNAFEKLQALDRKEGGIDILEKLFDEAERAAFEQS